MPRHLAPLLPLCLCLAALSARAEEPLPPGMEGAEVLPGWEAPDGSRIAALKIALDPGWRRPTGAARAMPGCRR